MMKHATYALQDRDVNLMALPLSSNHAAAKTPFGEMHLAFTRLISVFIHENADPISLHDKKSKESVLLDEFEKAYKRCIFARRRRQGRDVSWG